MLLTSRRFWLCSVFQQSLLEICQTNRTEINVKSAGCTLPTRILNERWGEEERS